MKKHVLLFFAVLFWVSMVGVVEAFLGVLNDTTQSLDVHSYFLSHPSMVTHIKVLPGQERQVPLPNSNHPFEKTEEVKAPEIVVEIKPSEEVRTSIKIFLKGSTPFEGQQIEFPAESKRSKMKFEKGKKFDHLSFWNRIYRIKLDPARIILEEDKKLTASRRNTSCMDRLLKNRRVSREIKTIQGLINRAKTRNSKYLSDFKIDIPSWKGKGYPKRLLDVDFKELMKDLATTVLVDKTCAQTKEAFERTSDNIKKLLTAVAQLSTPQKKCPTELDLDLWSIDDRMPDTPKTQKLHFVHGPLKEVAQNNQGVNKSHQRLKAFKKEVLEPLHHKLAHLKKEKETPELDAFIDEISKISELFENMLDSKNSKTCADRAFLLRGFNRHYFENLRSRLESRLVNF